MFTVNMKIYLRRIMSAPSEAGADKPDNPAHAKVSHQHGIEPHGWGGNNPFEAVGIAVHQP